eukprot:CAMPEP_0113959056 /NCGR_PEP_ID=MMETSP0011_2-20120614/3924_1 /TAXON_ID=101924 /ORGANISM="Rhodosorus marinus" /LENGTH=68 /DNA_ID=CAMNT_0000970309 /DNA_START=140 /DNA_END=346 /DNA_ORIENTATION=- /assembly_acc=CAM_ASM_000156
MQQDAQQNISAATPTPTFPRTKAFQNEKAGTGMSDPLHKADWPYSQRTVVPSLGEGHKLLPRDGGRQQ